MKIKVEQALRLLREIKNLGEHQNEDKETIRAIIIPADKSKTGYWIGRLADSLEAVQATYNKELEKNQKQFSTPAMIKGADGKEVRAAGQMSFDAEGLENFNKAMREIGEQEEELMPQIPFEYEMFDGIAWPTSFWKEISPFLKEPK